MNSSEMIPTLDSDEGNTETSFFFIYIYIKSNYDVQKQAHGTKEDADTNNKKLKPWNETNLLAIIHCFNLGLTR